MFSTILVCDIVGSLLIVDSSYIQIISLDDLHLKSEIRNRQEDIENALLIKNEPEYTVTHMEEESKLYN